MSRPLRIEYPGAWYHVMNRGRRRERIFSAAKDYEVFITVMQETAELLNLKVAAYCLMPNHYHLLLHTPDGNLSRCMRHINGVYTQRFNRRHKQDGQLFRGRYKSVVVADDSYLLEVLRYIHKNPIRAGIVRKVGEYAWSSHNGYTSRAKKWHWLYKDFLLAMFSDERHRAGRLYREFVQDQEPEEIEKFYLKKNLPSILGGEDFKDWIKDNFRHLRFNREIPKSKELAVDSARLRKFVCKAYGVAEEDLMKSRRGAENLPRDAAIFLQRKYCGQTLSELGRDYGIANYSSVSSALERMRARLLKDRRLKGRIAGIEERLDKGQKET